jgi:glutamyl-tRNA reductase
MPLVVVGLSHHSASVEMRERFAFAEAAIPAALQRLKAAGLATEAVLLSTCNRVELYIASTLDSHEAARALGDFLVQERELPKGTTVPLYAHQGQHGVEHLFKVACGLDSLVLGETEVLGQLKRAYDIALQAQHTGKLLNRAFQRAFSVAKQVRTETNIQRGSTSVASVSVELAERVFDSLNRCQVMVIGAGDTSEKTVRALVSRGARNILVSNRSPERALELATRLGGHAIPFDAWEKEFSRLDIVISSTAATHHIIDRPRLERLLANRSSRPLLLIDIAVPRDIDPDVDKLEGVILYNIDHLQAIADESLRQRRDEITRCEVIIREKAAAVAAAWRQDGTGHGENPGSMARTHVVRQE